MAKITLDVDNKDLDTVMTILKNLKSGLIKNISTNKTNKVLNSAQNNTAIRDDDGFMKSTATSKYLSKAAYKQKINTKG